MGSGVSQPTIKDLILNGNIEEITKNIREEYNDDTFPHNNSSIGADSTDEIVWLRPREFGSGKLFPNSDPRPDQCIAGSYRNDNSVSKILSPVCSALCLRPDYLKKMFLFYNPIIGMCCLKMWSGTEMEMIIIDDRIPCHASSKLPIFSRLSCQSAWLPLLEKAIAKKYGGYHLASPVGGIMDMFRDISGEIVLEYDIQNIIHLCYEEQFFHAVLGKFESGMSSIVCALNNNDHIRNYAVSYWGYDSVPEKTPHVVDIVLSPDDIYHIPNELRSVSIVRSVYELSHEENSSLVLRCPWKEFSKYCQLLWICLLQSNCSQYRRWTRLGSWSIENGTAAGGRHLPFWRRNPIFRVQLLHTHGMHGLLRVSLSQPDRRSSIVNSLGDTQFRSTGGIDGIQHKYEPIALTLLKDDVLLRDVIAHTGYKSQRDVHMEVVISEEDSSFLLIPSTYECDIASEFALDISLILDSEVKDDMLSVEQIDLWQFHNLTHNFWVEGAWTEINDVGRISNANPDSYLNPSYHIVFEEYLDSNIVENCRKVEEGDEATDISDPRHDEQVARNPIKMVVIIANLSGLCDEPKSQSDYYYYAHGLSNIDISAIERHDLDKPHGSDEYEMSLLNSSYDSINGSTPPSSIHPNEKARSVNSSHHTCQTLSSSVVPFGAYVMTPFAYGQLVHHQGYCGSQQALDGFLGKIIFSTQAENARLYSFCLEGNAISGDLDYRQLVVMASTYTAGERGRFFLEVHCNHPFHWQAINPKQFPCIKRPPTAIERAIVAKKNQTEKHQHHTNLLKQVVEEATELPMREKLSYNSSIIEMKRLTSTCLPFSNDGKSTYLDPKYSQRHFMTSLIRTTSQYGRYAKEHYAGEELTPYQWAKKTHKKKVKKFHYTGVRHYTAENYYWDEEDENDVSMIATRSQYSVSDTLTRHENDSLTKSRAQEIRDKTQIQLDHLKSVSESSGILQYLQDYG